MLKKILPLLFSFLLPSCNIFCKHCNILEFRKWRTDLYKEQCVFSNYHETWEQKNCQYRLVKPDPDAKKIPLGQTIEANITNLGEIKK